MHDSFLPDVRKGVVTMSILIKGMEMPKNCDDCRFDIEAEPREEGEA